MGSPEETQEINIDQGNSSEPLYGTRLPDPNGVLTVANIAAIMHRAMGTLTDVALHPRGCRTCEQAVECAQYIGIPIPPLYRGE